MSEMTHAIAPVTPGKGKFDDRIDTDVRITNQEVLSILGRSLKLLARFPRLFWGKILLSTLADRKSVV